jgi:hypothetical protein
MNYFILNEFTNTVSGPFTPQQLLEQAVDRNLKPNTKVRPENKRDWYTAESLIPKVIETAEKIRAKRKQDAKDASAQAKAQRKAEHNARKAERRKAAAEKPKQPSLVSKLSGNTDSPEKFVKMCDTFIYMVRVCCWFLFIVFLLGYSFSIAGSIAYSTANSNSAAAWSRIIFALLIVWVPGMLIAYLAIEAQVLFLRFLKHVVSLLNQQTQRA